MHNSLSPSTSGNNIPPLTKDKKPSKLIKVESRFGELAVDPGTEIFFKHGILGIPNAVSFYLTTLPGAKNDQFMLLQCKEDNDLSFIVVPSQYDNQLIKASDLDDACKVLDYETENLIVLFIVTVHDTAKERYLSINAKAPVLVDANSKTASQYVLQNGDYQIQHRIS